MRTSKLIEELVSADAHPAAFGDEEYIRKNLSRIKYLKWILMSMPIIVFGFGIVLSLGTENFFTLLIAFSAACIGTALPLYYSLRIRESGLRKKLKEIQQNKRITGNR